MIAEINAVKYLDLILSIRFIVFSALMCHVISYNIFFQK